MSDLRDGQDMVTSEGPKVSAIILDGDDTLWDSQALYEDVKARFATSVEEEGFNSSEALELLDQIDTNNVAIMSFSKARFPQSMVETYEILCRKSGKPTNSRVVCKIKSLGNLVFQRTPTLFPETLVVLRLLTHDFMLVLATKGDPTVQRQRLKGLGLESYFDLVFILPQKTEIEYREIIKQLSLPPDEIWVVGNSVRSDINPALRLGLKSVLISRPTWRYEDEPLESEPLAVIASLVELLPLLNKHNGNQNQLSDQGQTSKTLEAQRLSKGWYSNEDSPN